MKEAVTLLHVYSQPYELRKDGKARLWPRNRMVVISAVSRYEKGQTEKLFIAGGYIFGEEHPSISEVIRDELIRRGVKTQDIVTRSKAMETSEEIEEFQDEAQLQVWGDLSSISTRAHGRRIKLIQNRMRAPIRRLYAESILAKISPHYQHFVDKFHNSIEEILFLAREAIAVMPYYLITPNKVRRLARNPNVQKLKSFLDK